MAAVGVADRVGVVLEQVDLAADALFAQAGLGPGDELVEDPLPRLVVGHDVGDRVALGGGVLGVAADVEVETGAVLEEDVGRASPADDPAEQVPGHLVGAEAALAAQGAGDPVLVLDAEDALVHQPTVPPAYASELCQLLVVDAARKARRPLPRLSMATSRSPAASVRSGPGQRGRRPPCRARRPGPSRPATAAADPLRDGLGLAAQHGEAVLVGDRALVGDVVQLVGLCRRPSSATRISTSSGFISWVNTLPRYWA